MVEQDGVVGQRPGFHLQHVLLSVYSNQLCKFAVLHKLKHLLWHSESLHCVIEQDLDLLINFPDRFPSLAFGRFEDLLRLVHEIDVSVG